MTTAKFLTINLPGLLCFLLYVNGSPVQEAKPEVKSHTVEIVGMKFNPAEILVKKGDKIVFVNKDMVAHNATEKSKKTWKSPEIAPGKSWSMTASESAEYYCTLHPVMKGKITVKP